MNMLVNQEYRLDEAHLETMLVGIGYFGEGHARRDADDTQFLARQLEHIRTQTFDILFPNLRAREFIPVDNSVANTADTVTYRQWEMFGAAAIISNYADDSPRVDTLVREFTGRVVALSDSYAFSMQDLRNSASANAQLETRKTNSARRGMEQTIDEIAAFGKASANLPGFLNFVNVPIETLPTGTWSGATPIQILNDINFLATSVFTLTNTVHSPDTFILDVDNFELIATTVMDPVNSSNDTIMNVFLRNSPHVNNVDQWYRLNTAGVGGVPRLMMYERTPDNVMLIIPQEFEQIPPQARNFSFIINCHARIGGVEWHYPLSAVYTDDAG